jgi:hypothetical protein
MVCGVFQQPLIKIVKKNPEEFKNNGKGSCCGSWF